MKKVFAVLACLCLMISAAFAEETIELNISDLNLEELQAQGAFQQIELTDLPTVSFWVPSVLSSVDVSVIEGPFKPTALYATEDQNYSMTVFVAEIASLEEYATLMESEGGGSDFHNIKVNGVDCIAYEVTDADIDSLIYPVSDTVILSINFNPLRGDEGWDATKAAIIASIQPVAE